MASSIHDFTDSEPEGEADGPRSAGEGSAPRTARGGAGFIPGDGEDESPVRSRAASKPKSTSTEGGHPLRITLRPSINHLMHSDNQTSPSGSRTRNENDRSAPSLSPPPPITLKLGFKHAMAEKAAYSSSDDDEPRPIPPPAKKKRANPPSKSKDKDKDKDKGKDKDRDEEKDKDKDKAQDRLQPPTATPAAPGSSPSAKASVPAQHRKSYDWLAPSTAGASHRGPPERERTSPSATSAASGSATTAKITGWSPADEAIGGLLDNSPEVSEKKPRKSHKRRPDGAPPGPGKAWRKGIKKGMTVAKNEDSVGSPAGSPQTNATYPASREGSPDLLEMPPRADATPIAVPRAPSPPFVLANAKQMGIPVYPKPIVAPKIHLGAFPKVTQYFAPINGGDVGPFPRKEPVRSWANSEKITVGIAGGHLKVKTWMAGPPSELSKLVQADKEAKELARLAKVKAGSTAGGATTPTSVQPDTPTPAVADPARPPLTTANSFDAGSTTATPLLGAEKDKADEEVSEIGGDEDSVTGSVTTPAPVPTTPSPAPKAIKVKVAGGKSKAKQPRKSKLANEIVPTEEVDDMDVTPVATPVP
ncbi:hypothetical protein IAU60_000981 [Kwoniella sp. DSM 27419]